MRLAVAVLFALASASASAQVVADCTVPFDPATPGVGCRIVTDPEPAMIPGVDLCQLWNGGNKLAQNTYVGGTYGCVFFLIVADGVTVNLTANHWRLSDGVVSGNSNTFALKSVKAIAPPPPPPPPPPVPAPLNLKLAAELRAIADKIAAGKPLE
jgi:hypothetical protein